MIDINSITKKELVKMLENSGINPTTLDTTRYIGWSIKDVQSLDVHTKLSDADAFDILERAFHKHDATMGITWDILKFHADSMYPISNKD